MGPQKAILSPETSRSAQSVSLTETDLIYPPWMKCMFQAGAEQSPCTRGIRSPVEPRACGYRGRLGRTLNTQTQSLEWRRLRKGNSGIGLLAGLNCRVRTAMKMSMYAWSVFQNSSSRSLSTQASTGRASSLGFCHSQARLALSFPLFATSATSHVLRSSSSLEVPLDCAMIHRNVQIYRLPALIQSSFVLRSHNDL